MIGANTFVVPDKIATNTNSPDFVQYAVSSGVICPISKTIKAPPKEANTPEKIYIL